MQSMAESEAVTEGEGVGVTDGVVDGDRELEVVTDSDLDDVTELEVVLDGEGVGEPEPLMERVLEDETDG